PRHATLFPYTTLFRSRVYAQASLSVRQRRLELGQHVDELLEEQPVPAVEDAVALAAQVTKALPQRAGQAAVVEHRLDHVVDQPRSEEHTSELQSRFDL